MADVRAMLRVSREARRINHPNASYTSDGKLHCNLCETSIKSEAAWQSHLHSSSHTLRSSRAKEAATVRPENGANRKRKASMLESPPVEDRKKSKSAFASSVEGEREADDSGGPISSELPINGIQQPATIDGGKLNVSVVEDEEADPAALAALERELAGLEEVHRRETATQTGITISAAPMTAEEIAAQAREEQSTQRGQRDAELEAEKEDAARFLEDEFDEMEGLEERVRKLREKREALRKTSGGAEHNQRHESAGANTAHANIDSMEEENEDDDDDDDDDDDNDDDEEEGIDDWQFGAR